MLLMRKYDEENSACLLSHPVRGAWIEIPMYVCDFDYGGSHPVRGAWIEMILPNPLVVGKEVAPRQGCVD